MKPFPYHADGNTVQVVIRYYSENKKYIYKGGYDFLSPILTPHKSVYPLRAVLKKRFFTVKADFKKMYTLFDFYFHESCEIFLLNFRVDPNSHNST